MSYRVVLSDEALDSLHAIPDPAAAELIIHRINLYLAEDPMERSHPAQYGRPIVRIHRYQFARESASYDAHIFFRTNPRSDRELLITDIAIRIERRD